MRNIYNFSAGPAMLPEPVLAQVAAELTDFGSTGQSVMELSHRSTTWRSVMEETEARLRALMKISDHYKVLFLQGGASSQFAMVPLTLMNSSGKADYVLTGQWATKAYQEGARYGTVRTAASSADRNFAYIPPLPPEVFDPDADYVHICMNNTIFGTRFRAIPDTGAVPLVGDVSSCILSEPLDVSRFGLLYAGAQKNMGIAGLTVVIVQEDLLGRARNDCPAMFNYRIHADHSSMYNTPPCFSIYIALLVLRWLGDTVGGLERMANTNKTKAKILYNRLDASQLFQGTADPADRSWMNVPFTTGDPALDRQFLREAAEVGLVNLSGHRAVGGMRASLYNAMPVEGVEKLAEFMVGFEERYGTAR